MRNCYIILVKLNWDGLIQSMTGGLHESDHLFVFHLYSFPQIFEEKAYIVGVEHKRHSADLFGVEESLNELTQLADTAGLMVVGSTYQK